MICSRTVFRCFKALERLGDRITGAAGPYFVAFAIALIGLGTVCFFDVIMPSLRYPLLSGPVCVLIAANLWTHYYYVVTVAPGFADEPPRQEQQSILWAKKRVSGTAAKWTEPLVITRAAVTKCRRCGQQKPERTHHCRICNRCVLKYDHHWVNQCVGLHNERHFVLFMAYLVIACTSVVITGVPHILRALGAGDYYEPNWPHHVPQISFILIYILSVVMALAVGVMCAFHLWGAANGETTVEGHDHDIYRKVAKGRGETFVNSYDLGKRRNLELFFNIGEGGYPLYTLLLPLRINPYTDGRSWARRRGCEDAGHGGVRRGEELTDEDDDGEEV
ncbi:DHHC palmitoyltransferase-domain-containing protein [Mycena belliarum]|uniref:Palmitoyltransferase n=1 Tax=Mycena belliarum TaxID=1033014 RepID=A0AAD6TWS7_9AGAR|nr:DHHC palmitoyltransferase-domain-containing protein [Mycena belliae]